MELVGIGRFELPSAPWKGAVTSQLDDTPIERKVVFYFASVYFWVVYCRVPHTVGVPSCVGGSWKTKSVCKTTCVLVVSTWERLFCFRCRLLVSVKVQQANDLWLRTVGIEPTTSSLWGWQATSAPRRHIYKAHYVLSRLKVRCILELLSEPFVLFDCINIIAEIWEKVKILNGRNFLIILRVALGI